jgi:polyhydroxyalkanoate synthesis regulator phasin
MALPAGVGSCSWHCFSQRAETIHALERRVAELEAQLRPSEVSYRQAQLEHLHAKIALLRAQVEAFR